MSISPILILRPDIERSMTYGLASALGQPGAPSSDIALRYIEKSMIEKRKLGGFVTSGQLLRYGYMRLCREYNLKYDNGK